jgi:hypothetical protein
MKSLLLSILLLFSLSAFSEETKIVDIEDEGVFEIPDACEVLYKELEANFSGRSSSKPLSTFYKPSFGASLKLDFNDFINAYNSNETIGGQKLFRSKFNNIVISNVVDKDLIEAGISVNTEITKVNNKLVEKMTDEEILSIFPSNDEISIEFKDSVTKELKTVKAFKQQFYLMYLEVDLAEKIITHIDSKKSEHTANINLQLGYLLLPVGFIEMEKIHEVFKEQVKKFPLQFNEKGFACHPSKAKFLSMGLYDPTIRFLNQISNLAESNIREGYTLSYTHTNGQLDIYKKIALKNGVFKDNFKFQTFPFDSQKLRYDIKLVNGGWSDQTRIVFKPEYGAYQFLSQINDVDINEWKHASADYENDNLEFYGYKHQVISFIHGIERNYSYYIFKIILPIIIILFISLSVLWIRPEEIEARLTVSIVCLLSLIAYTFIIDKDIPKLSYLTIMDYVVLVSYFFAVLPTLQTIFVHNYIGKSSNTKGLDYARKMDRIAIKVIPTAYFIILFLIFSKVISGNINTIKSLTF